MTTQVNTRLTATLIKNTIANTRQQAYSIATPQQNQLYWHFNTLNTLQHNMLKFTVSVYNISLQNAIFRHNMLQCTVSVYNISLQNAIFRHKILQINVPSQWTKNVIFQNSMLLDVPYPVHSISQNAIIQHSMLCHT
ncbi:unnamed protein product, partial [Owenia fusiformis]